ncbi:pirin family protein [Treponema sp.]
MSDRKLKKVLKGRWTMDGAGVRLLRIFANQDTELLDPFLLLDAFGSTKPDEYLKGFPFHPHRGMETVTYMLEGKVKHRDSLGNTGEIGPGDLQWMSAGSGILHEEMPQKSPNGVSGLQLWVNLPRAEKMKAPEYLDALSASIPTVKTDKGLVRPIAGSFMGTAGPLATISRNPSYFDIHLDGDALINLPTIPSHTAFAFAYEGELGLEGAEDFYTQSCLVFGPGDEVNLRAGSGGCRFIFASAEPLHESVAWGGPIVMNTKEELETAFKDLEQGTFIKDK